MCIEGWTHSNGIPREDTIHECKCGCRNPEPDIFKTIKLKIFEVIKCGSQTSHL